MSKPDPAIEDWIRQNQKKTDAELRTLVARKVHHCMDYKGAQELLDRREKNYREQERIDADRRHSESVSIDRSARNIGWAGFGIAVLALVVAVFALPQVQSLLSTQPTVQSQPNPAPSSPAVSSPVSPLSSPKVDNTTLPKAPSTIVQPKQPPADDASRVAPTPAKPINEEIEQGGAVNPLPAVCSSLLTCHLLFRAEKRAER